MFFSANKNASDALPKAFEYTKTETTYGNATKTQADKLRTNLDLPTLNSEIKLNKHKLSNKYGVVDPTVKPNISWKDTDILSVKDLIFPVSLTDVEGKRVAKWMGYRKNLLDLWERQDLANVDQSIKKLLNSVKNQLRDHMQPKDLAGLLKENRGVKIYDHKGKALDHVYEWKEARNSMENALEAMQSALFNTKTSAVEMNLYKERISQTSKMWDKYEKLLEKIDCRTKPKL